MFFVSWVRNNNSMATAVVCRPSLVLRRYRHQAASSRERGARKVQNHAGSLSNWRSREPFNGAATHAKLAKIGLEAARRERRIRWGDGAHVRGDVATPDMWIPPPPRSADRPQCKDGRPAWTRNGSHWVQWGANPKTPTAQQRLEKMASPACKHSYPRYPPLPASP